MVLAAISKWSLVAVGQEPQPLMGLVSKNDFNFSTQKKPKICNNFKAIKKKKKKKKKKNIRVFHFTVLKMQYIAWAC